MQKAEELPFQDNVYTSSLHLIHITPRYSNYFFQRKLQSFMPSASGYPSTQNMLHEDNVFWSMTLEQALVNALKMKAAGSSEMVVTIYQITWCHTSKDGNVHSYIHYLHNSSVGKPCLKQSYLQNYT